MGLLSTLKSILGLSSNDDGRPGDGDVRVEHEPTRDRDDGATTATDASASTAADDEAAAAEPAGTEPSADAETGGSVEPAASIDEAEPDRETNAGVGEPVATETDAAASTESLVDENVDAPEAAAEPPEAHTPTEPSVDPEAGGAVESNVTLDDEGTDTVGGADEEADDAASEPTPPTGDPADGAEPVETVRGIGPAYAERLAAASVETVDDLAAADAADLAERIEVAESRVDRWIDRARDGTDA
ncbi:MAG: helix-hairpin-helix domain-containing protein [Haloferacaceae archaeon]